MTDPTPPQSTPGEDATPGSPPAPDTPPASPPADDPTAAAGPPADAGAAAGPRAPGTPPSAPARDRTVAGSIVAFAVGAVLVMAAYVAVNNGSLRAANAPQAWGADKLGVARGTGKLEGNELVARAPANDVLIVSLQTNFRARDLSAVAWEVAEIPAGSDVRLLFQSDYTPKRVHNRPLAIEDGRVLPASLAGDTEWLGRITGLAIAVKAPGATIRVRGVTAKSQSAVQIVRDRSAEWFRLESWTGTSINAVTGGAVAQSLPLPAVVTLAALIALAAIAVARRFAPARFPRGTVPVAMALFLLAWAVLDARWTVNLVRQVAATIERYGGKDAAQRNAAAEDGDLVAFLDKAKALLPADPQRVVVLAQAHYFRGRAGWHLLPHRVLWEPARDVPPQAGLLRPGDFVVVWQRPGAQFDTASGRLRFENGVDLPAKLLLAERGAAVFTIL